MALWLPGWTRVNLGLSGKPFEYTHNPKGLLHSTEGTSLAGAESAMRNYPSHLGYDYRTRQKHQYISLDLAAYSAMDQSDDDPIYQVELVGFAKDMRYLPDWALRNIAEDVIKPLADTVGIPARIIGSGFKDGLDGIYPYIASAESPIRLSYTQLRAFSGWLGHQHLPAPDNHWDPGAINMARLLELAYGEDDWMADIREPVVTVGGISYSPAQIFHLIALWIQANAPGTFNDENGNPVLGDIFGANIFTDHPETPEQKPVRVRDLATELRRNAALAATRPMADVDEEALADALEARGIGGASASEVKAALIDVLTRGTNG
jgi:hypothetical protein